MSVSKFKPTIKMFISLTVSFIPWSLRIVAPHHLGFQTGQLFLISSLLVVAEICWKVLPIMLKNFPIFLLCWHCFPVINLIFLQSQCVIYSYIHVHAVYIQLCIYIIDSVSVTICICHANRTSKLYTHHTYHHYQYPHQWHQEALNIQIAVFCSDVIVTKSFKLTSKKDNISVVQSSEWIHPIIVLLILHGQAVQLICPGD